MSLSYIDNRYAEAVRRLEDSVRLRVTLKSRVTGLARAAMSAHPAAILLRVGSALAVAMWLVQLAKSFAG